jgi:hypothetical protein
MAPGAANAPETALDGVALVKRAGKEMASVSEAVGPLRPSPGQANGAERAAGAEHTADGTDGEAEEAAGRAQ